MAENGTGSSWVIYRTANGAWFNQLCSRCDSSMVGSVDTSSVGSCDTGSFVIVVVKTGEIGTVKYAVRQTFFVLLCSQILLRNIVVLRVFNFAAIVWFLCSP